MKKQFDILKERPQVELKMTRDSVAAGDDCNAPHEKNISIHSFLDPVALASHLSSGYLPGINGTSHTWDCNLNNKTIAIISVDGIDSKISEINYKKTNHVHFVYHSSTS